MINLSGHMCFPRSITIICDPITVILFQKYCKKLPQQPEICIKARNFYYKNCRTKIFNNQA